MIEDIKKFAFNGILASHSVRDMVSRGLLRSRQGGEESKEDSLFAPVANSIWSGSREMQKHFRVLFVFENIVRDFIDSRLTELYGANWFDDHGTASMKKKVENRKKGEESNQWHGGIQREPIYYLDFGDLGKLLVNSWHDFDVFFPNQSWVLSRLDEAQRSRNVVAHTNLLKSEDGKRLEMYLRDWINQVG